MLGFILAGVDLSFSQIPYVVLPEEFKDHPVLIKNSQEFQELIKVNKDLQNQLQEEKRLSEAFSKEINIQVIKNQDIQSKLLKDYNQSQINNANKSAVIAKQALWIGCLVAVIISMLLLFGALLYLRVIRFGGFGGIF